MIYPVWASVSPLEMGQKWCKQDLVRWWDTMGSVQQWQLSSLAPWKSQGIREILSWKDLCDHCRALQETDGVKFKRGFRFSCQHKRQKRMGSRYTWKCPAHKVGYIWYYIQTAWVWEPLSQTIRQNKRKVYLQLPEDSNHSVSKEESLNWGPFFSPRGHLAMSRKALS